MNTLDSKWATLSQKEKSDIIRVAINNDIKTLPEIREAYNKFAEGGPERSYDDFASRLSKAWDNQDLSQDDYDYLKYYNDDPEEAYRQLESIEAGGQGHFPDGGESGIYKLPSHPTYPDLGDESWSNNDTVFHISDRQLDGDTDRLLDYLGEDLHYNNGSTRVMYGDYNLLPSIQVTPGEQYPGLVPNKYYTGWVYEDSPKRTDSFSLGGNLFDNGGDKSSKKSSGYAPSQRLMRDIATWEGSEMERNAPFSEVTRQFNATVPASVRAKLTTNQLDALYSYGYNVGMGNLKKRVLPTLTSYIEGKASNEDVQKSMWASKDNVLRGLTRRRNWEREMFGGNYRTKFTGEGIGAHYDPTLFQLSQSSMDETNNMINNVTLPSIVDNTPDPEFAYTPPTIDETLFRTPKVEIPEVTYDPKQDKIDGITRFNTVMGLMGQSTPFSGLVGSGSSGLLDAVGKIYS